MSRLVLDCSITMSWCFEDESQPFADLALDRVLQDQILVPAIWLLEVANVLLIGERKGRLTPAQSLHFLAMLENLPIIVDQPASSKTLGDIFSLARTYQLTAYDASYLELAMREGAVLATLDKSLTTAAEKAGVGISWTKHCLIRVNGMGQPSHHSPALLLLAAFSRHGEALDWAKQRAEAVWGPIELESPRFDFSETEYYTPTMGAGLKKMFFAFVRPFDPADMVDIKLLTNQWEDEYANLVKSSEPRPLNLDPGYITLGKLILASTKDFAHRIYLNRGIYAEVTLYYKHRRWQHHDYTFADYRRDEYQHFFTLCRETLHKRLRK